MNLANVVDCTMSSLKKRNNCEQTIVWKSAIISGQDENMKLTITYFIISKLNVMKSAPI